MKIELEDGKYTVIFEDLTGKFYALRHGEPWRDLTGDGLVLSMAQRINELEEELGIEPDQDIDYTKEEMEDEE